MPLVKVFPAVGLEDVVNLRMQTEHTLRERDPRRDQFVCWSCPRVDGVLAVGAWQPQLRRLPGRVVSGASAAVDRGIEVDSWVTRGSEVDDFPGVGRCPW